MTGQPTRSGTRSEGWKTLPSLSGPARSPPSTRQPCAPPRRRAADGAVSPVLPELLRRAPSLRQADQVAGLPSRVASGRPGRAAGSSPDVDGPDSTADGWQISWIDDLLVAKELRPGTVGRRSSTGIVAADAGLGDPARAGRAIPSPRRLATPAARVQAPAIRPTPCKSSQARPKAPPCRSAVGDGVPKRDFVRS